MVYSNDIFHYMFKAEFVTLVSLKIPSGLFFFGCGGVEVRREFLHLLMWDRRLFMCKNVGRSEFFLKTRKKIQGKKVGKHHM